MGVQVQERRGAWWIFINHGGQRKAKRVGPGDEGRRAARQAAEKIQARLVLGDLTILEPPKPLKTAPLFRDVAADWERVMALRLKRGTQYGYGSGIRVRLNPAFGDLPITEVTADRVEEWWVRLRNEGMTMRHVASLRSILKGICRRAVSLGLIQSTPVDRIDGPMGKTKEAIKEPADCLTADDLGTFLQTAERVCLYEYPAFLAMATCGLRVGEAVGLQVGDMDVPGLKLHIRRTARRGYVNSPKNGKARVVDVPDTTMAVLQRIREIRQAEAAVAGTEARWLFPSLRRPTNPLTPETMGNRMRKILRAAGIRKIRPHDLRYTYATLAIQAGVDLLTVSRQLEHSSIAITADIYAHAVPGGNRAAADVMESILTGNQTQPRRNQAH
jgi:integrase